MTTSRIVRGTKARVFLYICAVLFVTGLIACYNNVRVQLEDTHKSFDLCRQEQENLSTQLQVIYDYKQRLEKSLKTEKGDHQRTKNDLDTKFNEEKLRNEKINNDEKLRFSTLQQHYNILQTEHDGLKEECSKIQRSQLDEINNLQSKLKEVQEQLKAAHNDKEHSVKHLMTQNELLKGQKQKLLETVEKLKGPMDPEVKRTIISTTRFSKQAKDKNEHYIIPIVERNDLLDHTEKNLPRRQEEDFKNVLVLPSGVALMKSSTPKTSSVSRADINNVPPLKSPTLTPEPAKKSTSKEMRGNVNVLAYPLMSKRVPEGFVPVPDNLLSADSKKNEAPTFDVNGFINNRYRGNMFDPEAGKNEDKEKAGKEMDHDVADDNAHEEFDLPNNARADEFKGRNKIHIDDLAAGNKDDPDYDGPHLQEGEDDDAADGDNPVEREPQEPAIRN